MNDSHFYLQQLTTRQNKVQYYSMQYSNSSFMFWLISIVFEAPNWQLLWKIHCEMKMEIGCRHKNWPIQIRCITF